MAFEGRLAPVRNTHAGRLPRSPTPCIFDHLRRFLFTACSEHNRVPHDSIWNSLGLPSLNWSDRHFHIFSVCFPSAQLVRKRTGCRPTLIAMPLASFFHRVRKCVEHSPSPRALPRGEGKRGCIAG